MKNSAVLSEVGQQGFDTHTLNARHAHLSTGEGQGTHDDHVHGANPHLSTDGAGRAARDTQSTIARTVHPFPGEEGHLRADAHSYAADLSTLIAEIREQNRMRIDFLRAENRLILQMKAICRRFCDGEIPEADKLYKAISGKGEHEHAIVATGYLMPLMAAKDMLHKERLRPEKRLQKLAKDLPVWEWVESVHGFGAMGLGQIVGEAGDLSNYANPAKLWKRMGLAVFDGKSQRKVCGAAAIEQGYSPQRRSMMFVIGDSLIKKQNPYRELYLARKVCEQEKLPEGTKMHWHRRAQRYMEKRLLRDLWRAWRA
jgi:hypothetical protein